MSYRLGRVIDHVGVRVSDYAAARPFYMALFEAIGLRDAAEEGADGFEMDEFCVGPARKGGPVTTGLHICLQAPHREAVARAHAAGLAAGGRDNGGPGLRDYHEGYFAAFLLDPDGNNIEIKADERVTGRSGRSIEVRTG